MNKNQQVDLPLVFFGIAFVMILLGLFSKFAFQKGTVTNSGMGEQISITPISANGNTTLKNLNYNGPIKCDAARAGASVSAQLDGASVTVVIQQKTKVQRMTVEGDCLYSWVETEKTGQKKCGVGQYLSMGKQLLGSGLATADSVASIMKQMGQTLPVDLGIVLQSCKNVKKVNLETFVIPKGIVFR